MGKASNQRVKNEVQLVQPPDIIDRIIKALGKKKTPMFMDTDSQSQLISYKESEQRLICMGIGLAIILCMITSFLVGSYIKARVTSKQPIYFEAPIRKEDWSMPVTKIALIDMVGTGQLYKYTLLKNQTFAFDWSMKLPSPKASTFQDFFHAFEFQFQVLEFIGYEHLKKLQVLPLDGKDGVTIRPNNTHRKIPDSGFEQGDLSFPTSVVRTSGYLWVFGSSNPNTRKSLLWSIKRNKWMKGPKLILPTHLGTGISRNRSHVTIFSRPHMSQFICESENTCMQMWTYNFVLEKWIVDDPCIILMENRCLDIKIESTSTFNKLGTM